MSAPVDVLAVMDHAAFRIENLREIAGYEPSVLPAELREARAAAAELVREADIIAAALDVDGRTVGGMTKATAAKRLRAALARCTGGRL